MFKVDFRMTLNDVSLLLTLIKHFCTFSKFLYCWLQTCECVLSLCPYQDVLQPLDRGKSRKPATMKTELIVTIATRCQPLTIVTNTSILDIGDFLITPFLKNNLFSCVIFAQSISGKPLSAFFQRYH